MDEKPKALDYPEVPNPDKFNSFDLGINDEHKGNTYSQVAAYALLVISLTALIAYYLSS